MARLSAKERAAFDRGFANGVAVACGIIQSCFDRPGMCAEALVACGYETRAKLKKAGVQDYDLKLLRLVFAEIRMHKR